MKRSWKIIIGILILGNVLGVYSVFRGLGYRSNVNVYLDKYTNLVAEFSKRSVYAEDNRLLADLEPVKDRLVFFGSQVTSNWPLNHLSDSWEVINRGIPHQRAAGFLLRFRPDVIELHPRAVVIEMSSYNLRPPVTAGELTEYVFSMTELARLHDIIPVILTIIPPVRDSSDLSVFEEVEGYSLIDSITQFNSVVKQFCAEQGVFLVDANQLLADNNGYLAPEYSAAAIDPNSSGYARITRAVEQVLTSIK